MICTPASHARVLFNFASLVFTALALMLVANAQTVSRFDRDRGKQMLKVVKDDIKKHYYDVNYRNIDVDARFKIAEENIDKATSLNQVFGIIAQAVLDFDDSHTFFLPPPRPGSVEYGWQMQMISDKCYVTAVKPGSDAEAKGLKPGDLIQTVNGFAPTRKDMWKMQYYYNALAPQGGLRVVVRTGDAAPRQLDVMAKVRQGKRILDLTGRDGGFDFNELRREIENDARFNRHRFRDAGGVFIWKMPAFDMLEKDVDEMMGKVRNSSALVLDLRGNGGGYESTLQRLVGHFFDRDLQVAELKGRKPMKPMVAKTRGADKVYKGRLFVLIDSRSGSASELFARIVQLEKRGVVIGDTSGGKVMRSLHHSHQAGDNTVVFYGVSVTDADAVMSDGKSLEHTGVTPDEILLPTGADMAANRDPVLARALRLAGFNMDAGQAGSLFPIEWRN